MHARKHIIAAVAALALVFPGLAAARTSGTLAITGGGFGHGIGMSQYGAMGYAEHGWNYQAILGHYYQGTTLGSAPNSTVTVLLKQGASTFTGATSANGKALSAKANYGVLSSGSKVQLISGGRTVGTFSAPLKVTGSSLDVIGLGQYAGSLEFFPSSGGVLTVNAVDLEDYVKGVIADEMPASWPEQALETQAVAARTYVLASQPVASQYDVYSDTRSQMYGGVGAETSASNLAASSTAGQVVEANGVVIPTYFSASSGGHTESIQNVWVGTSAEGYLTGVSDPYDDASDDPYYRWNDKLSLSSASSRLAGLYKGALEGIKVLKHGLSPRIVSAQVVGTRGSSTVSGATLESDLGTMSTWMSFTTVTAQGTVSSGSGTAASGTATPKSTSPSSSASSSSSSGAGSTTGGAGLGDLARSPRVVSGTVFPFATGATVSVQQLGAGGWHTVGTARVGAKGAYALRVLNAGAYRAVYHGAAAPTVTLR